MYPKRITTIIMFLLAYFSTGVLSAQSLIPESDKKGYSVEIYGVKDLKKWESFGKGLLKADHGQTVLHETEGSKGYMLVSPKTYSNDIIVSYDVMALNAATILVSFLYAHNTDNYELYLDAEYDGNIKYLFKNMNMYMFVYHNAAHNKPGPLVRKFPIPGIEPLQMATKHEVETGKYYHVEIGKEGEELWLKIDEKKILKVKDPDYYKSGKVILRLRGTGRETASCLIKNLKIYSRSDNN